METTMKKPPLQRPVLEEGPEGGVMVKVPFPLLPMFKAAFPYAKWNAYGKVWIVPARGAAHARRWVAERQGPPPRKA